MTTPRRDLSPPEELFLLNEADGTCPECRKSLFYKKGKKTFKGYEVAHIYPLNPKPEELVLLAEEIRLSDDVNDLRNLIVMCPDCHGQFDKPRTVEDYRRIVAIKQAFIAARERKNLEYEYRLEEEIAEVIRALDSAELPAIPVELSFEAKSLEEKLPQTMPAPLRRKIHHNVKDYFSLVRQYMQALDRENPGTCELISTQVRAYYLAQKKKGWNHKNIFEGVAVWIRSAAGVGTHEAAEVVASFFVQNCEVFE